MDLRNGFLRVYNSAGVSSSFTVTGSEYISGSTDVTTIQGSTAGGQLFNVLGTAGQLFSVTDGLSGSLFSVNTISGLPIMEAFSDATIRMGNYGSPSLIITGSRVASQTLVVTGSFTVTTGSLIEFQVTNTGTKLENLLLS